MLRTSGLPNLYIFTVAYLQKEYIGTASANIQPNKNRRNVIWYNI